MKKDLPEDTRMITGTQASTNISIHLSFLDKRLVKPLILIMS